MAELILMVGYIGVQGLAARCTMLPRLAQSHYNEQLKHMLTGAGSIRRLFTRESFDISITGGARRLWFNWEDPVICAGGRQTAW